MCVLSMLICVRVVCVDKYNYTLINMIDVY